jgi:hypothetical protein
MWLTSFGRNYYPGGCNYSQKAATFDGVNDYAITSAGLLKSNTSGGDKQWVSFWIKDLDTSAQNAGETMFSQGFSGNSSSNAWYLAYNTRAANGTNLNAITFQWQSNGTSNRVVKRWNLFGANTPITGATSITDFWLVNNSNINVNVNGYVHLLLLMDIPQAGQPMSTGNYDLYWNGQKLTLNTSPNIEIGNASAQAGTPSLALGWNNPFNTAFSNANIDELFMTNSSNASTFMSANSLTTDQDVANYLYNNGCPVDVGNDGRWSGGNWRFENSWTNEEGTLSFNPINGATFTTDHA